MCLLATVILLRVWSIAGEATHRREVISLIGHPLPPPLAQLVDSGARGGVQLLYIYTETCPYCGIDYRLVWRVASDVVDQSPGRFIAVHVGFPKDSTNYWMQQDGLVPVVSEVVSAEAMDHIGISAVPVVILVQNGLTVAAWQGKLGWDVTAFRAALRCRLGILYHCVIRRGAEFATAMRRRWRSLAAVLQPASLSSPDTRHALLPPVDLSPAGGDIAGEGVADPRPGGGAAGAAGDQLVSVKVKIPEKLTPEQEAAFRAFAGS